MMIEYFLFSVYFFSEFHSSLLSLMSFSNSHYHTPVDIFSHRIGHATGGLPCLSPRYGAFAFQPLSYHKALADALSGERCCFRLWSRSSALSRRRFHADFCADSQPLPAFHLFSCQAFCRFALSFCFRAGFHTLPSCAAFVSFSSLPFCHLLQPETWLVTDFSSLF